MITIDNQSAATIKMWILILNRKRLLLLLWWSITKRFVMWISTKSCHSGIIIIAMKRKKSNSHQSEINLGFYSPIIFKEKKFIFHSIRIIISQNGNILYKFFLAKNYCWNWNYFSEWFRWQKPSRLIANYRQPKERAFSAILVRHYWKRKKSIFSKVWNLMNENENEFQLLKWTMNFFPLEFSVNNKTILKW